MSQNSTNTDFSCLHLSTDEYQLLQGPEGMPEPSNFLQHLLTHTSENSMMNTTEPEYSVNSLQYLNNSQSMQAQRGNDQGSYYTNTSPHSEQQYHSFNPINAMYHTSPSHAGMSSPTNMTPTSPKKSPMGQGGERRFTFPPAQSQITTYGMPHATATSPTMPALPETTRFPGEYGFELSFGPPTEGATKSIDYTYSHALEKLYVQRGAHCPFKFKSERKPPEGSYVKCLPVFKGTHVLSEPVKRCSNHAVSEEEAGNFDNAARYHFVRSDNAMAKYDSLETGRLCVTFPFTGPQVGAEFQTELLSFQCFNSCGNSAHAKRRIDIIFTLEHSNHVLGRQVIEVRVCACPGRDRQNEEQNLLGRQRKRRASQTASQIMKKKKAGNAVETYTITTSCAKVHDILIKVQSLLESVMDNQSLEGSLLHLMHQAPVKHETRPSQSQRAKGNNQ